MPPFSEETLKPSVNQTKDKVPSKISSEHQKSVIPVEKKDISSITVPLEERDDFDFTFKRDWEITEKTKNVSVRGRLKQNIAFWKNELKPFYFVKNINNGYIMPLPQFPHRFMLRIINLVYVTLSLYHKLLQNYWKITVSKNSNKNHIAVTP